MQATAAPLGSRPINENSNIIVAGRRLGRRLCLTFALAKLGIMRAKLLFKILLSMIAGVAAAYYAVGSVQISGIVNYDFTAAAVIRERCPIHLVKPAWISGTDQGDILIHWCFAETQVRVVVLLVLWALIVSGLLWQYFRRRRHDQIGEQEKGM